MFDRPSNYSLSEKAKEVANYDYHIFAVKHTKPKPKAKNQEISYSMKELKNEEDIKEFDASYVIKIAKDKDVKKITAIAIKRLLGVTLALVMCLSLFGLSSLITFSI